MVVPLGPGKFYGSSLPRPRFYTDIKLNDERVDPPVSVLDPLLSWANEAHWSMGGLSFNKLRLQGKIEGNLEKLRKEKEKIFKKKEQNSTPIIKTKGKSASNRGREDSPQPAPISKKRKLWSKWVDEEEEELDEVEEEELVSRKKANEGVRKKRRRLVRKLGDDFEKVVSENGKNKRSPLKDVSNGEVSEGVATRTRNRRSMVLPLEDEDEEADYGRNSKKSGVENGEAKKNDGENGSVTPKVMKKSGEKGSVSPNGRRSSPRLK